MNTSQSILSISAMQKHNIPLSFLRFHLINNFHIPETLHSLLKEYYILHWESHYTLNKIKNGCINGFQVVYKNCTPTSLLQHDQVRLSFRESISDYGSEMYVLLMEKH